MKKFLFVTAAIILALIAFGSVGHMIGMAISLLIVYYSLKQFTKTESTGWKIVWAIIGLVGISGLIGNLPALVGIIAVYLLYTGYKKWKTKEIIIEPTETDPFTGFERQWKEMEGKLRRKGE
ncbi:flagellar basal body rod protein [Bacillus sp. FJAT-50079]|uniref:lmo0954 family membrane protein n=1 Tax=Bacillus sp. FJAT-50079 TaxID=2833577 RepID=UPI001BC968AA|nr:flagellar basal body rod protein [Bacillus sp. FJAT-50079]MBS4207786.1 flagellar basal body rod protein [Bacillus sp. FJAT-50079]